MRRRLFAIATTMMLLVMLSVAPAGKVSYGTIGDGSGRPRTVPNRSTFSE